MFFFFNDTATTEIYTLSLHDALPIFSGTLFWVNTLSLRSPRTAAIVGDASEQRTEVRRSEEHTSELQSRQYLVCRLLLEKKKIDEPLHPPRPCDEIFRLSSDHPSELH